MYLKFICPFILLIILNSCTPSRNFYVASPAEITKYKMQYSKFLEKSNATFVTAYVNYTVEKKVNGSYIYKQYQPQKNVLQTYAEYNDEALQTKNGTFIMYGDDGRILQRGNYISNRREGLWQDFNQKGKFVNDKKEGEWVRFSIDSLGNLTDTISFITYENDIVIKEDFADASNELEHPYLIVCKAETKEDKKKCNEYHVLKELYSTIVYPRYARETGIEGLTYSEFIISETGKIEDIKVFRTLCNPIEAAVINSIKQLPDFQPGKKNGKNVNVRYYLPVRFKLAFN